jgi:hypothetical protein
MQKSILLTLLLTFTYLFSAAQTPKIAFIDWDSIRNQVDLYKTHESEVERFKAFIAEMDSLKVVHFQTSAASYTDTYQRYSCSGWSPQMQKYFYGLREKLEVERSKIELFESLMPKITDEFTNKSKEWADDFLKLKIRYYADSQGFKSVYGVNKLLFNRDDFNKKIIETINKDENAKEAQAYFIKFLNNKIRFDYNLE